MSRYLDEIYKNVDKDFEREKEEKEMFRDSMKYYYYFQTHGVKYKPEPVDDVGASPIHVAAAKGSHNYESYKEKLTLLQLASPFFD